MWWEMGLPTSKGMSLALMMIRALWKCFPKAGGVGSIRPCHSPTPNSLEDSPYLHLKAPPSVRHAVPLTVFLYCAHFPFPSFYLMFFLPPTLVLF